jgi:Icc-related predicted phosphoesterase
MNYSHPRPYWQPVWSCREIQFKAQYEWSIFVKILAVSDEAVDRLYTPQITRNFSDVDMILGCGDLPYEYLEFLVTALNVPLLYVPGNHDPEYGEENPASRAEGCILLDNQLMRIKGLSLAGLGGSLRYKPGYPNQFSQSAMYGRVISRMPGLLWNRFLTGRVLDIMIAHSPPHGIHDDNDPAHIGFLAFRDFIHFIKPRYFLHGHTMAYKGNLLPSVTQVGSTTVINVYPYRLLEVEPNVR